jgi:hypothetical protein
VGINEKFIIMKTLDFNEMEVVEGGGCAAGWIGFGASFIGLVGGTVTAATGLGAALAAVSYAGLIASAASLEGCY